MSETSKYVVAFLDILGASELIKHGNGLQIIHQIYEKSLDTLRRSPSSYNNTMEVRIFSDNIVIAHKVGEQSSPVLALQIVMTFSSIIQKEFLSNGILIRGGISYDDFFIDDIMVWGKALLSSYKLESTVAIYPRIILDPVSLGNYLPEVSNQSLVDNDGITFIDYFKSRTNNQVTLKRRRSFAEGKAVEYSTNLAVKAKWSWHLSYLDTKIRGSKEV